MKRVWSTDRTTFLRNLKNTTVVRSAVFLHDENGHFATCHLHAIIHPGGDLTTTPT